VRVERLRRQVLMTAERQQLGRQRGASPAGIPDDAEILAVLRCDPRIVQHLAGEAEHRLQDVVEVVGNTAGQGAHRLQFLRLAQPVLDLRIPLLGQFERGDVA